MPPDAALDSDEEKTSHLFLRRYQRSAQKDVSEASQDWIQKFCEDLKHRNNTKNRMHNGSSRTEILEQLTILFKLKREIGEHDQNETNFGIERFRR